MRDGWRNRERDEKWRGIKKDGRGKAKIVREERDRQMQRVM